MALTLAQIQTNITNNGDARQILNQIADYLQANPGGGSSDLEAVLTEDNDAGGLTIDNLADPTTDQQAATKKYVDDNAGGSSYLSYAALLTQSGTDAPVATVLENTLGFVPTFTRETDGEYTVVKAGGWDIDKTWFVFQPCDAYNDNSCLFIQAEIISDGPIVNQIYFTTRAVNAIPQDWGGAQGTTKLPIEIRIYP